MKFQLQGQTFILSPVRSVFWEEQKLLIIADAHFSKEMHFRKNGIAVPSGILQTDLVKLDHLMQLHEPQKIIFLGDMFHSDENEGLNEFMVWRKKHKKQKLTLITGNHDVLHKSWYSFAGIDLTGQYLQIENLILSHNKILSEETRLYNLYGHIHPCVVMHGKAKQSLRLPCFWFGKQHGVLPSFGSFTGSHAVRPDKEDRIFAIGENEIFQLQ